MSRAWIGWLLTGLLLAAEVTQAQAQTTTLTMLPGTGTLLERDPLDLALATITRAVDISTQRSTPIPVRACLTSSLPTLRAITVILAFSVTLTPDENGCIDYTIPANRSNWVMSFFQPSSESADAPNDIITITLMEDLDNSLPAGVTIDTTANTATLTIIDNDPRSSPWRARQAISMKAPRPEN